MSPLPDRKQDEVRRLLYSIHTPVPADLALRAVDRGGRTLRRRHVARTLLWTLALLAAVAFTVWVVRTQPWEVPPTSTTPPVPE